MRFVSAILLTLFLTTLSADGKKKDIGTPVDKEAIVARVLEGTADLRQDVALAIRAAVRGLIGLQAKNGRFGVDLTLQKDGFGYNVGPSALAVYALSATWLDDEGKDKELDKLRRDAVKKGLDWIRKADRLPRSTYEINVLIMALEAAGDLQTGSQGKDKRKRNPHRKWIEDLARKMLQFEQRSPVTDLQKKMIGKVNARAHSLLAGSLEKSGDKDGLKDYRKRSREISYGSFKEFGYFHYFQRPMKAGQSDLSNMQYAILGLKAASRTGVKIKKEFWRRMLVYFLTAQMEEGKDVELDILDGKVAEDRTGQTALQTVGNYGRKETLKVRGFSYQPQYSRPPKVPPKGLHWGATYSMTTSGVGGLLICRSELYEDKIYQKYLSVATDLAIREGIGFLGNAKKLCVVTSGKGVFASREYYTLYGIERVGVMAGVENMGRHVWFRDGCGELLKAMVVSGKNRESATWVNLPKGKQIGHIGGVEGDRLVNSSFALLFLGRATLPLKIPRTYTIVDSGEE